MRFTYDAYGSLLDLLKRNGYESASYFNWRDKNKCVILRHDIDNNIAMAHALAAFERDKGGVEQYIFRYTHFGFIQRVLERERKFIKANCGIWA